MMILIEDCKNSGIPTTYNKHKFHPQSLHNTFAPFLRYNLLVVEAVAEDHSFERRIYLLEQIYIN